MKRRSIYKKSAWERFGGAVPPLLFTLAVMGAMVFALRQAEESSRAEGLRILEDSIRHAVVKNYAVEGRYPESIAYIEENFGINIDWTKYIVHYRIFASNILPEVSVIELR